jgi:hypothetical protein
MSVIAMFQQLAVHRDFLTGNNYFLPASATRNRVTPGEQFLIHANIKASFEDQVRPKQTGTDASGNALIQRTNQAVARLERVY